MPRDVDSRSNSRGRSRGRSRSRSRGRSRSRSGSRSDSDSGYSKGSVCSKRSSRSSREPRRNSQIFIAKLTPFISERDLRNIFIKYGRIKNLNLKRGYAFLEYVHRSDAKEAIYHMDGRRIGGQRIVVQEAMSQGRDRRFSGPSRRRTGPKETDLCYNCGGKGHWANECTLPKKQR